MLAQKTSAISPTTIKVRQIKLVKLKKPTPVYDLTSPITHNFALGNGVIVHNCQKARDTEFQDVIPLKGKPLNVMQAKNHKIFGNTEIKDLLQAIGYNPEQKNFGYRIKRVIILTDADVDGDHIGLLLSSVMFKLFRPLIESGNLYCVEAPLFKTQIKTKRYHADTLKKLLAKLPENMRDKVNITRMKGLGEADAALLEEVAFNPKTRKLRQIIMPKKRGLKRFLQVVGKQSDYRKELLGL